MNIPGEPTGRGGAWGQERQASLRAPEASGAGGDRITLHGLRVFARHGVQEAERRDGQEFLIDAVLWLDTRPAAASDDLTRTVDYGTLADRLVHLAGDPPANLIETLAERLATACLADPAVAEVEITVHKPHAPIAHPFDDVTITIRRARP